MADVLTPVEAAAFLRIKPLARIKVVRQPIRFTVGDDGDILPGGLL